MLETDIARLVLEQGARRTAVVHRTQIVMNAAFRDICAQNSCGCYGKCWMCPPDAGDIHMLMDRVRQFEKGILYQSVASIEDSFDVEGMLSAGQKHAMLSQRIQKAIPAALRQKAFHLSSGGCRLCVQCAKLDEMPCRFPAKALLSLEACGIDVYQTAKNVSLPYINGKNTVTYFGLVLFEEGTECPN